MTIDEYTTSDGYRSRFRRYEPATSPARGEIVCIHGVQSHGGWYEHSCTRLSQAGFRVTFLDRRGSGLNDRDRGDTPGFGRLLDDLAEFVEPLRPPVFLAAISWGGKLGVALQRRHPGLVAGLALLCPGFFPRVQHSLAEKIGIGWSSFFRPRRRFRIPLNEPELFTANPRWQEFLRQDSLRLHDATARFFVESVRLDRYLRRAPEHVRVPVLLLLAEKDRIIDNARTRSFVDRFASGDKEVIEYAGAHHTLEFEPDPDRYINDMVAWLDRVATGHNA